jgi:hypothetical protein
MYIVPHAQKGKQAAILQDKAQVTCTNIGQLRLLVVD